MGNGLSKEQEQCFRLIQQLFKAPGCLPDKGSLDLEIWGKAGQRSPHDQESLDKKRRGLWDDGGGDSGCLLCPSHGSPQLWQASQPHLVSTAGAPALVCSQHSAAGSLHWGWAAAEEGRFGPPHLPSSPYIWEQPFPLPTVGCRPDPLGPPPGPRFHTAPCLDGHLAEDLELVQTAHHEGAFHPGYPSGKRQQPPCFGRLPVCLVLKKGFLICLHFYNCNRWHF